LGIVNLESVVLAIDLSHIPIMPRGKSTRKSAAKVSPKKEKKAKDEDEQMVEAEEVTKNNTNQTPKSTHEVEQSDDEDNGDKEVGSLPLSLGRSGSMHSLRIKEKQEAGKFKKIVTQHIDHKYVAKDFVAVSSSSEEKFWIGRVDKGAFNDIIRANSISILFNSMGEWI